MNKEQLSDNLITVPAAEELDNIDALLRDLADEETAQVDFEAIKARSVASARAKKASSKKKRMRILSYIAAAACMLFCFGIIGTAASMLRSGVQGNKPNDTDANLRTPDDGLNTPDASIMRPGESNTPEPFSGELPSEYTQYLYGGKAENTLKIEMDAFRGNLPSYMEVSSGNAQSSDTDVIATANGTDPNGRKKYFDCSIISEAPYDIAVGDIGSFAADSDSVFYWRFDDDEYLCARYFGFDSDEAEIMFKALIEEFITDAKQ